MSVNVDSPEKKHVVMDYDDDTNQQFEFAPECKKDEKLNSDSSTSNNSSNGISSNSGIDSDSDSVTTAVSSLTSNRDFLYLDLLVTDQPDEFHETTSSNPTSNNSNNEGEKNETKLESCQEKNTEGITSLFRNKMKKMTLRETTVKEDDLKQLISSKQWQDVSILLRNIQKQNKRTTFYFQFKCNDYCTSSHGLLHHACRFNEIPYSIVKKILQLCPDEVYEMDCSNRNALHVAVDCGLSVEIIAMLIKKNPLAAQQACSIGNTPLHWAILSYKHTQNIVQEEIDHNDTSSNTSISYYIKLFKLLAKAAPNTIKAKNCIGDTPFEIVLRDRNSHTNAILNILWRADTSSTKKSSVKQYGSLQVERIINSSGDIMFKFKTVVTPNPYSS